MKLPRILVVEDEDALRRMCQRALEAEGWHVTAVESGDRAVEQLGEEWDVVVTDLRMPGRTSGLDLLRLVRAQSHADVILMTAYAELDSAVGAVRGGADDYLMKPFTADVPVLAVKRCLAKRALSAELTREKSLRADLERAYQQVSHLEQVKKIFGQFATPEVAQFILQSPESMWRRGVRCDVTVLFADVRGFTWFSEDVSPEDAVEVLNQVLSILVEAIQREGGSLNKFVGDGVMGIFGAPLPLPDHASAAARAALWAQAQVEGWSHARRQRHVPPLHVGIGLNTGQAVAGCIGTMERAEYTVIGHAVNLASRFEKTAGAGEIIIGPATAQALGAAFQIEPKGSKKFRGVAEPLPVYQLMSETPVPTGPTLSPADLV